MISIINNVSGNPSGAFKLLYHDSLERGKGRHGVLSNLICVFSSPEAPVASALDAGNASAQSLLVFTACIHVCRCKMNISVTTCDIACMYSASRGQHGEKCAREPAERGDSGSCIHTFNGWA